MYTNNKSKHLSNKIQTSDWHNHEHKLQWREFLWTCEVILFWIELKWSEVSYGEILEEKSTVYIRVTFYRGYFDCIVLISMGV